MTSLEEDVSYHLSRANLKHYDFKTVTNPSLRTKVITGDSKTDDLNSRMQDFNEKTQKNLNK